MRGPLHDLLVGGLTNNGPPEHSTDIFLPTLDSANTSAGNAATWVVPSCDLRQVRTTFDSMDPQTLMKRVVYANISDPTQTITEYLSLNFSQRARRFSEDAENKVPRQYEVPASFKYGFSETYRQNEFVNSYGKKLVAWDFKGARGTLYPGSAGMVLNSWVFTNGATFPLLYDAASFPQDVLDTINYLEQIRWIDLLTSLVQVSCSIWNPSNNLQAYAFYSVEFTNAGKVTPMQPSITIGYYNDPSQSAVSILLLVGLVLLQDELQDLVMFGPKDYFGRCGWINLIDWSVVVFAVLTEVVSYEYLGLRPSNDDTQVWSLAASQELYSVLLGLTMFCTIFRGLKFSSNVPIMCRIGSTFSQAVVRIGVFLVVLGVLFLSFGVCFNIMYSTDMEQFSNLGRSLFTLFEGLLGNMDSETMLTSNPTCGPLLFAAYVITVLFVGLTILIAIISDSYETTNHTPPPSEGVVIMLVEWLKRRSPGNNESVPELQINTPEVHVRQRLDALRAQMAVMLETIKAAECSLDSQPIVTGQARAVATQEQAVDGGETDTQINIPCARVVQRGRSIGQISDITGESGTQKQSVTTI